MLISTGALGVLLRVAVVVALGIGIALPVLMLR